MRVGYIRKTDKKSIDEQSELLIASNCSKLYVEAINNTNYNKEKLTEAIKFLNANDILVVTRLSILSSTVQKLLDLMFSLQDKNITLEAIEQQFVSSDEHTLDELLFYLMEFVEDIRLEKQAYGIQKSKVKGKRFGRPPKMTKRKTLQAIELKKHSTSTQVANRFGVGRSTLLRHIANYKSSNNVGKTKKAG